jgi:hypothetical protein
MFNSYRDAFITFENIVFQARKKGIDGVAITDHNIIKGALKFVEYIERKNIELKVIVGEEIRTNSVDVLALNITDKINPYLSLEETLDSIKDYDGIAVAPHPFSNFIFHREILEKVESYRFDAIETYNASCLVRHNKRADILATRLKISKVGGSDAHLPEAVGDGLTEIRCDGESIINAIKKGKTKAWGINNGPTKIFCRKMKHWTLKYLLK